MPGLDEIREMAELNRASLGIGRPSVDRSIISTSIGDVDPKSVPMGARATRLKAPPPEPDGTSDEFGGLTEAEARALSGLKEPPIYPVGTITRIHASGSPNQRVAIWAAREDGWYIVHVEEAPDWDSVEQWRMADIVVRNMIPLLQTLGVKLKDCSGELGQFMKEPVHEERTAASTWSAPESVDTDREEPEGFSSEGGSPGQQEGAPRQGRSHSRRNRRRKHSA